MVSKTVKIHELINTCVILAQRSAPAVRQVQRSGSFNIVQKGISSLDVCSEADLIMHKTISHNLKQLYSHAKTICEEDDSASPAHIRPNFQPDQVIKKRTTRPIFTPEILSSSSKLRRTQYKKHLNDLIQLNPEFIHASDVQRGLENQFQDEYDQKDLTIWIDPLDGSSGLAEGHTEHLTCIIGVAVKNRPLFGIVHKPFSPDKSSNTGRTLVGVPQCGLFSVNNYGGKSSEPQSIHVEPFSIGESSINQEDFQPRVCGSHNKNQHKMNHIIQALQPQSVERVAGSGNKFVHLAENRSDYYLNFVPGFKNWDMCGSEAILSARFGVVTDAYQKPIQYNEDSQSHTIKTGIIAAKNKDIYQVCKQRIEDSTQMSLELNQHMIATEALQIKLRRKLEQQLQGGIQESRLYPSF